MPLGNLVTVTRLSCMSRTSTAAAETELEAAPVATSPSRMPELLDAAFCKLATIAAVVIVGASVLTSILMTVTIAREIGDAGCGGDGCGNGATDGHGFVVRDVGGGSEG